MGEIREAQCAFVIVKLPIDGEDHYVLREDPDWGDLSLVGGHMEARDNGKFVRTARRELYEEMSSLRGRKVSLVAIGQPVDHGPVRSRADGKMARYRCAFFLASVDGSADDIRRACSDRSLNRLVSASTLSVMRARGRLSSWLSLADRVAPGGLDNLKPSVGLDRPPSVTHGR